MRFWPGWPWLHEQIRSGVFGAVRSASFERVGAQPDWSPHFYRNVELTGGPLHELHVHDADFVLWCFGEPAAVHTVGDASRFTTRYRYGGGDPSIAATGGWVDDPGFPFHMRYRVEFEDAVADFAHDRDDPLLPTRGGGASLPRSRARRAARPAGDDGRRAGGRPTAGCGGGESGLRGAGLAALSARRRTQGAAPGASAPGAAPFSV